jgi:hypothetical protein
VAGPKDEPRKKAEAPGDRLAARRKREADALRTNLRKRKDQARARKKAQAGVGDV